jgi:hypothetical protein
MTLIASMLADMPELRLRVQAQHVPDQLGYCADCRDNIRWPCEVSRIAAEAERRGGPVRRSPAGMPWSAPMAGSIPGPMAGSPQPYLPSPMSPAMSQPLPPVGALPGRSAGYASGYGSNYGSGYASSPASAYGSSYGSGHLAGSVPDPLSAPMYQGRYV